MLFIHLERRAQCERGTYIGRAFLAQPVLALLLGLLPCGCLSTGSDSQRVGSTPDREQPSEDASDALRDDNGAGDSDSEGSGTDGDADVDQLAGESPGAGESTSGAGESTSGAGESTGGEADQSQQVNEGDSGGEQPAGDVASDEEPAGEAIPATPPETDGECVTGAERCSCYPNDTCDLGLSCLSALCVDASGLAEPREPATEDPLELVPPVSDPEPPNESPSTPLEPVLPSDHLGSQCSSDTDCDAGLRCMLSSSREWLGGGPANGYCTADCIVDPGICAEIDPSAVCLQLSDTTAYCMQSCGVGSVSKCDGRGDVACDAASIDIGFCRPICRSHADCGNRLCDVGTGACVDALPAGDPIGAECDPEAATSNCESQICLPMTETFAVCSGWCNLSETGCGLDNDIPREPGEAICTFGVLAGSGLGDLGYCNQRCDCDADCLHPDGTCLIVPSDVAAVFGSDGLCVDPEFPDDDPEFTVGRACPSAAPAR
jgi:hypothetical protein